MECFKHQPAGAVGLCKNCYKAVCRECAIELENGLACSDECAKETNEYNEITERSKKIYGIGGYQSKIPSSGVFLWGAFALVMWGLFIVPYVWRGVVLYENVVMAVLFSLATGIAYYSSRRTGVKC